MSKVSAPTLVTASRFVKVDNVSVVVDYINNSVVMSPMSPKACFDLGKLAAVLRGKGIQIVETVTNDEVSIVFPLAVDKNDQQVA